MVTIGFSRATEEERYQYYVKWLKSIGTEFDFINFYGMEISEALVELEKCSGLVLTGGADVHPSHYGKGDEESRCECDTARDVLEFTLIRKALEMNLPVLAICRGEQVLNISQGGDLIIDIHSDHGSSVVHTSETDELIIHTVDIDTASNLYNISRVTSFEIVSVHHQAVNNLAPCFRPSAFAADGIIEAFEWLNPEGKGYLNAVQWHPEKGDYTNYLSQVIGRNFIENVILYKSGSGF